jgi:hypothetical protein
VTQQLNRGFFRPLSVVVMFASLSLSSNVLAWGDEGHEIIGLIADHYLDPAVKQKVEMLLAGDTTHLTGGTDIAHEATWADKYRDMNNRQLHYTQTRDWHFVDIEIEGGDFDTACFNHPALPAGTLASQGIPQEWVVDKVSEFVDELKLQTTSTDERRMALQFLLHFVGDLHQPLHASDDHDRGANNKTAKASGIAKNNLHHDWDTEFVKKLGTDPTTVANGLIAKITTSKQKMWSKGTPKEWAVESNAIAKAKAYGPLATPDANGVYVLSASYVTNATKATATQLSRAGVRLANVLNKALR